MQPESDPDKLFKQAGEISAPFQSWVAGWNTTGVVQVGSVKYIDRALQKVSILNPDDHVFCNSQFLGTDLVFLLDLDMQKGGIEETLILIKSRWCGPTRETLAV